MLGHRSQSAIRAIVALAKRRGSAQLSHRLADESTVPRPYFLKLMGAMVHAGLITAKRGRRGGYSLKREPASIRLADIVEIFEDSRDLQGCMLVSRPCGASRDCAAQAAWKPVMAAYARFLDRTTVADLLGDPCRAPGSRRGRPRGPRPPGKSAGLLL